MALNAALLQSSLELVVSRRPEITPRFYEILFTRHPEARALFGRNSADAQAQMLQDAIVAVIDHVEDAAWLTSTLGAMGRKHVEYGVTNDMYPWVGDALVATLAEIAGTDWTPAMQAAWTEAFVAIQALMLAGAREIDAAG
ncbi:MAG: flavohemoprotein [bacterium]|nr:flavohemoprotein [bacterium]